MAEAVDFEFTLGDTDPTLAAVARDHDGTPLDLSGCTAELVLRSRSTGAKVTLAAPQPGAEGQLSYTFGTTDLPEAGLYSFHFRLTNGPQTFTVPSGEPKLIRVWPKLDR